MHGVMNADFDFPKVARVHRVAGNGWKQLKTIKKRQKNDNQNA
jgi:hypothetical protein